MLALESEDMKVFKSISRRSYYFVFLLITFAVCTWQSWVWWSWAIAPSQQKKLDNSNTDETLQIYIPSGTGAYQIGEDLEAAGLIHSVTAWKLWTLWQGIKDQSGEFKAGTYELSLSDSLPVLAQKIWQGQVIELSFTIPEGWSIRQMANYFESLGYFSAEEFIAATNQIPQQKYPWLPNGLPHLEGFLYPNTYQLQSDQITPQQVIDLMLNSFEQIALPIYQQAQNKTNFNLLQWVTLASIVEKEAVVKEERNLIAGVFFNRLGQGIKLETDPTVEYGLGIRQTADQPLTLEQVRTPSPYNTYLNPGLPPTAIASPGSASLKATLEPEQTEYLYFVARYDGTHVFSTTLANHEAATKAIRQNGTFGLTK